MSIVRTSRKPPKYTLVSNTILEDPSLSWRAKGLHTYLMSKPDHWEVWVAKLVEASTEGRDAVYTALDELLASGYAKRSQVRGKGGRMAGYDYTILETPEATTEDAPFTGKPFTVNPSQANTEYKSSLTDLKAPAHMREQFEECWRWYPTRMGGNSKEEAFKAWKARLAQGFSQEEILDGVMRYDLYCELSGRAGTEFVMQGKTFFGPGLRFKEDWNFDKRTPKPGINSGVASDSEESYAGRFS